ncbi:hypothetical protein PR202_gb22406 [Eleusine coracana subsp. coracana]|uniref:Uncharacterized protein n=1 Tax=Eleusine coracana subsp. coracana TaxID=191504 RepID=A0AAV5FG00_ELECO|nr:hypothetical protein QOZ80_6AG0537770 [Eleusine coracana subsp. coracana]GJN33783.1 hypothetical protein PR202_gb22406 [Eleusine coracana subsp. coracana]
MPCLAQDYHAKLPAAGHYCKSLSSLIRETYAHCHVPCVRIRGRGGWSSGDEDSDDDSVLDDAMETKQVILNEMRNRQMRKRSSADSPSPIRPSTTAFAWSYTPLDPRTVFEKVSSPKKCVVVDQEDGGKEQVEEAADDGDGNGGECDADDESEDFYSVKSFFTRSTSRGATVASSIGVDLPPPLLRSPETWEGFRNCEGWPFGLCRRPAVLPLPPLPSTPADSWKWRKSVSSFAGSPLPAYKTASSS